MKWDIGGAPALLLAVLVAAAVFGATVWLWPRLAGSGVRPVLGRAGFQLAITLTAGSALLLEWLVGRLSPR